METQKTINYRIADISDYDAIVAVGEKLFDYEVIPGSAREFLTDSRHHMVLAYTGDNIIGMASGFHYVHPDKKPALFINEVGVVDEYQSHGVGRSLVEKLVEFGRGMGCRDIWVATEHSNNAARRAYAAAGGKEDPEPVVLITFRGHAG